MRSSDFYLQFVRVLICILPRIWLDDDNLIRPNDNNLTIMLIRCVIVGFSVDFQVEWELMNGWTHI